MKEGRNHTTQQHTATHAQHNSEGPKRARRLGRVLEGSGGPNRAPRKPQEGSKRAPRRLQEAPKRPQEGPMSAGSRLVHNSCAPLGAILGPS
eukprot:4277669-Pyramimonas_sp.AAC.1